MRLKTKLLLIFVTLTFLVSSVISTLSYHSAKQQQLAEHNKLTVQILETEAQKFDSWLQQKAGILTTMSRTLVTPGLSEQQKIFTLQYHKLDPDINDIYIGFENGEVLGDDHLMTSLPPGYDPRKRPWYQEGITKEDIGFSQPYRNIISPSYIFTITNPIYFPEKHLKGLVAMDIDLKALSNYINQLTAIRKSENGWAFLIDKNGIILGHPNSQLLFTNILALPELNGIAEKILFENPKSFKTIYKGQEMIFNTTTIPSTDWTLGVIVPYKEILAPVNHLRYKFILINIVGILIATFCSLWIAKQISKPIEEFSAKTMRLANGDLEVKVPIKGCHEISMLANHFNTMAQQIKILIDKTKEASRLKSEFIATMSHELRTPLNSIIGFTQLVLHQSNHDLPEKHIKHLQTVERNGQHLLKLINQILDLSAIEAGKTDLILETFNCVELIDEVIELASPLAIQKQLKLLNTSNEKEIFICSDRQKLLQILINLTGNALKFTEQGEIKLWAESTLLSHDIHGVNILVSDTGVGIENKNLETIFEPFRQIDGSLSRKKGGSGIGLHLTRKICHLLKGTITVTSKINEGTTFCCSFSKRLTM